MRKFYLLCLGMCTSCIITAHANNCPSGSSYVHCAYINATTDPTKGKWIKAVMLPRNLTIIVCMKAQTTLDLERDDLMEDRVKSGTQITWLISQCKNEACHESLPLGIDQFMIYKSHTNYRAEPATYGFTLLSNYGEWCTWPYSDKNVSFAQRRA